MTRLFDNEGEFTELGRLVYDEIRDLLKPIFLNHGYNYRDLQVIMSLNAGSLGSAVWAQNHTRVRNVRSVAVETPIVVEETRE